MLVDEVEVGFELDESVLFVASVEVFVVFGFPGLESLEYFHVIGIVGGDGGGFLVE